jgi:hypothetical protein
VKKSLATLFFLLAFLCCPHIRAQQLGDLRWQYCVLLLMDAREDPLCAEQLRELREHRAAMQERDLLLFVFNGRELLDENGKNTGLGILEIPSPGYHGVLLLGKDGSIILRKPFKVSPEEIFRRLDAVRIPRESIRD